MSNGWGEDISNAYAEFMRQNALRSRGEGNSIDDRVSEGRLMASLLGPLAPLATVPVGIAGYGYEGVKGLAQKTGLGEYLPGPFRVDETTSEASYENPLALMRGYTSGWGD